MLRWLVCSLFFFGPSALWAETSTRLLNEAESAAMQGQPEKALTSIDRVLDQLKQGTVTGMPRARQLDQAGKILTGLREKEPQSVRAVYLLGEIRFLQNQFKEALEILNPLRSASLKDTDYFSLVGMCLGGLNQLSEAAQAVITAITLAPQRPDLYFNLAGLYQKAGAIISEGREEGAGRISADGAKP